MSNLRIGHECAGLKVRGQPKQRIYEVLAEMQGFYVVFHREKLNR